MEMWNRKPSIIKNMSHIAVERNRRRQMNEHLKVLRSLTPSFYIKRGDQASIIGGVVDFIKELHHILQVLDSKKRRKKSLSLSPRSPNPSPRPLLLVATPSSESNPSPRLLKGFNELGACCNSPVADVEAKLSGSNVSLRIVCRRASGQVGKIVSVLERLYFDVLQLNISSMEDTVLYSFVVKIGLECELTVEDLAQEIQKNIYQDVSSVPSVTEMTDSSLQTTYKEDQLANVKLDQYESYESDISWCLVARRWSE